jgi:hypothetical protein
MTFRGFTLTVRRTRRSALIVALLAGSVAVWLVVGGAGVASARGLGKIKAPIEEFNSNCGETIGADVIGTATFTRKGKGDKLKVEYMLTDGIPGREYSIELWQHLPSGNCVKLGHFGVLRTNADGRGVKKFEWGPIGDVTDVFATGLDLTTDDYNDSLAVSI